MSPPTGETSLPTLLSTLHPILHDITYVFLTIPHEPPTSPSTLAALAPRNDLQRRRGNNHNHHPGARSLRWIHRVRLYLSVSEDFTESAFIVGGCGAHRDDLGGVCGEGGECECC
ncbi:hypothetical protein BJX70DRAFT_398505 [Aspergillus crustosus]